MRAFDATVALLYIKWTSSAVSSRFRSWRSYFRTMTINRSHPSRNVLIFHTLEFS